MFGRNKQQMPEKESALPGRDQAVEVPEQHFVNGNPLVGPFPSGTDVAVFGMGCFWGAERRFWQLPGVYTTSAGYAGGYTANPSYEEVCTGRTGHTEAVMVVYRPDEVSYDELLKVFWHRCLIVIASTLALLAGSTARADHIEYFAGPRCPESGRSGPAPWRDRR